MQTFVKNYLKQIIPVTFVLKMNGEESRVGEGEPAFTVTVKREPEKSALLSSTSLALGEAYMRGDVEVDRDLYEVLDLFMGEMKRFHRDRLPVKKLFSIPPGKKTQEKEVQYHYDLGNDFYRLWLDESMSYSCGYFKTEYDTLYDAQVNKADHILEKLHLKKGMSILDIGCGWGFLLKRAVERYQVHGVGITLSRRQYEQFQEEIERDSLSNSLQVRYMDYRELKGARVSFDRVVSVGMLEHVGRENYGLFLEQAKAALKPGGLFLLHFISAQREFDGDAWMKKYIFPGGMVPSLREIIQLLPDYHFYTLDVESLRRHYNRTLLCWLSNFRDNREKIVASRGEEFARMWELYLASCAATFHNGVIDVHQLLLSRGVNNDLPMRRAV